MQVARSGSFSLTIESNELSKGLRPSKRSPRNARYLYSCSGAVGLDGVLQVIEDLNLSRINTAIITDSFPYPQIFVFTNTTIVCGKTKIYELLSGVLTLKLTVAAGIRWTAVDFYNFVYLSNGKVAVSRSAEDGTYTLSDLPITSSICNFNGQVLIGAPDVEWA